MIIDVLKTRLLQSRKSKDAWLITFFSTLVGEIEAIGKNNGNRTTKDEEAQLLMKSWIFNNKKSLEYISLDNQSREDLKRENFLLKEFLPTELSHEELKVVVKDFISRLGKNQGAVMKELKLTYPNQYEGKVASELFKELAND